MKKILLTGFEAFDGSPINPSEQVVKRLQNNPPANLQLETAILPVDQDTGPKALLDAYQQFQPDGVVCLGEAPGRSGINLERVAINLIDFLKADNAGNLIQDQEVIPGAKAAYFCSLPVRRMMEAIKKAGFPAILSLSAGTFLCNQVIFTLLDHLDAHSENIPAGFIHLPSLPEQVVGKHPPRPSMSLDSIEKSIRIALEVLSL